MAEFDPTQVTFVSSGTTEADEARARLREAIAAEIDALRILAVEARRTPWTRKRGIHRREKSAPKATHAPRPASTIWRARASALVSSGRVVNTMPHGGTAGEGSFMARLRKFVGWA